MSLSADAVSLNKNWAPVENKAQGSGLGPLPLALLERAGALGRAAQRQPAVHLQALLGAQLDLQSRDICRLDGHPDFEGGGIRAAGQSNEDDESD